VDSGGSAGATPALKKETPVRLESIREGHDDVGNVDPFFDFPRMHPPATVGDDTQRFLQQTKFYREGRPLYVHQVLSNHPRAAKSLNRFLDWEEDAVLSARERRMLILRTSKRTRCDYEWGVHSQQGERAGDVSTQEIAGLDQDPLPPSLWSERERTLLELADSLCRSDTLTDDEWIRTSRVLSAQDIIEALIVVGYYRMCAGLVNAVGVPNEGDLAEDDL
jgi:4-carboxymuconolactone decarboxylase